MLGNLFGDACTVGGLFGMLGSIADPQGGIVGMLQQASSMIPDIGTSANFIKNINTHLFLFIKYNYSLQQNRYANGSRVGTGFAPVRLPKAI
jgi:hypothetical protein